MSFRTLMTATGVLFVSLGMVGQSFALSPVKSVTTDKLIKTAKFKSSNPTMGKPTVTFQKPVKPPRTGGGVSTGPKKPPRVGSGGSTGPNKPRIPRPWPPTPPKPTKPSTPAKGDPPPSRPLKPNGPVWKPPGI